MTWLITSSPDRTKLLGGLRSIMSGSIDPREGRLESDRTISPESHDTPKAQKLFPEVRLTMHFAPTALASNNPIYPTPDGSSRWAPAHLRDETLQHIVGCHCLGDLERNLLPIHTLRTGNRAGTIERPGEASGLPGEDLGSTAAQETNDRGVTRGQRRLGHSLSPSVTLLTKSPAEACTRVLENSASGSAGLSTAFVARIPRYTLLESSALIRSFKRIMPGSNLWVECDTCHGHPV